MCGSIKMTWVTTDLVRRRKSEGGKGGGLQKRVRELGKMGFICL
ncbi:MAG: hypothetical protein CM15mP49_25580 [Actinomycetota bacterium]|nr:MAG: hypothetical protein CM15mP49_25580 [Actinomycetota bacterium]